MGTRGAFGFRVDNEDKITYNHFDSYPGGLGVVVADFINENTDEELRKVAKSIIMVNNSDKPTIQQIRAVRDFEKKNKTIVTSLEVSSQSVNEWYCLLRGAQNSLDCYKMGLEYMIDGKSFLFDSLFCEYAYIINVDTNVLEIYKGFNENPKSDGRYAGERCDAKSEYYGVALFKEIPFDIVRASSSVDLMAEVESEMRRKR